MPQADQFPAIYEQLRQILLPIAAQLTITKDTGSNFYIETPTNPKDGKPFYFGSTTIRRSYVSFYLMPVYTHPELLEGMSPELKKRMQGKSCFNFKKPEEPLFVELKDLSERSFALYKQEGYV